MEQRDDPSDRIKRALKNLPPVKAAPDFEARLQRRLDEPERREANARWWQKIFTPERVPAFGYSLMALVAVGFVSYYMFWRSGMTPEGAVESVQAPTGRATPAPPPVLRQGESAGGLEESNSGAAASTEPGSKAPAPREIPAGKDKTPLMTKTDLPGVARDADRRLESSSRNRVGFGDASPSASQAPRDEVSAPAANVQLQQVSPSQAKKAGPLAPQMRKQQAVPSTTYDLKKGEEFRQEAAAAVTAPAPDSAARRDSLRLDSLRRARAKKPPE
ncbi:MAG TPA: hypothetical protein VI215_02280 [Bacteroidota bacterium]